jgi:hypothetical protein
LVWVCMPLKNPPKKIRDMSEVIDFTEIKLKQLYEEYKASGNYTVADTIWKVLAEYKTGNAVVRWKGGLPFVKYLDDLQHE